MFLTAQGGILGPFAWLLGKLFDLIYNMLANDNGIANLGVCIILFTVIVKLLLFPLNIKQQKSVKINSVIQPEIQKIQKKYKDKKDQESMMKQQQEVQAVYDKYGTSMTGGCLTSFIQIPIIWSLYRVIQNVHAYVTKIKDMYEPIAQGIMDTQGDKVSDFLVNFVNDNNVSGASYAIRNFQKLTDITVNNVIDVLSNFGVSNLHQLLDKIGMADQLSGNVDNIDKIHSFILGINISEAPGYKLTPALIIPITSALFQYLSMKVSNMNNPSAGGNDAAGSMMKGMQIYMPLMSLFICITLPAGIGVYWSISALITLLTQLIINFYYDHQDMDAILEEQMAKAEEKRKKNGGKKSFMQRMMDQSEAAQEQIEKQQAMKKNSAASLRNYVPSSEAQKVSDKNKNKKYKEGSIGAKANIMMNYNNNNDK